jgi:hypothetical protein
LSAADRRIARRNGEIRLGERGRDRVPAAAIAARVVVRS